MKIDLSLMEKKKVCLTGLWGWRLKGYVWSEGYVDTKNREKLLSITNKTKKYMGKY